MYPVYVVFGTPVSLLALLIGLVVSLGVYWLWLAIKEVV